MMALEPDLRRSHALGKGEGRELKSEDTPQLQGRRKRYKKERDRRKAGHQCDSRNAENDKIRRGEGIDEAFSGSKPLKASPTRGVIVHIAFIN